MVNYYVVIINSLPVLRPIWFRPPLLPSQFDSGSVRPYHCALRESVQVESPHRGLCLLLIFNWLECKLSDRFEYGAVVLVLLIVSED